MDGESLSQSNLVPGISPVVHAPYCGTGVSPVVHALHCGTGVSPVLHGRLARARISNRQRNAAAPRRERIRTPLVFFILTAMLSAGGWGCDAFRNDGNARDGSSISSITLIEEFAFDEPSDWWEFRTPELWSIEKQGDRRFLTMARPPDRPLLPGVRRPQEYAIHTRYAFRSFNLACFLRIDSHPDVAGRDACIIFGRQDDTHFYYVHLSNTADEFHNALVRVDGDTRTSLVPTGQSPPALMTDRNWHRVDMIRDYDAGTITIYLDGDQSRPWLEVKDDTYEWGHIGLGSFNDHASFYLLAIEGEARPQSG